jgi:hypothetical protein
MSAKLLSKYQRQVEAETARITKFKAELDKDPAHALTWGLDAFRSAATLKVLNQIVGALEAGHADVENIRSTLMDRVLHRSKYPAQSTSPTSNLMEQYELSACAELLSDLQYSQ